MSFVEHLFVLIFLWAPAFLFAHPSFFLPGNLGAQLNISFNGTCGDTGGEAKACNYWDVNVILALADRSPDSDVNMIKDFLQEVTSSCDEGSTVEMYLRAYANYTSQCISCPFTNRTCKHMMTSFPASDSELRDPNDGLIIRQLFGQQSNCSKNLLPGHSGVLYFLTNLPCTDTAEMLKTVIQDQGTIVYETVQNNYILKVIVLTSESIDQPDCRFYDLFDFCSENGQLTVTSDLLKEVERLRVCQQQNKFSLATLIGIAVPGSVVILLAIAFVWWCVRKRRRRTAKKISELSGTRPSKTSLNTNSASNAYADFRHFKVVQDEWEIDETDLFIYEDLLLGKGAFASVYKGTLKIVSASQVAHGNLTKIIENINNRDVAVKVLSPHADGQSRHDFFGEIEFMKSVGFHAHVLCMIGCVSDHSSPKIITELCSVGDLLRFLRSKSGVSSTTLAKSPDTDNFGEEQSDCLISLKQLLSISWQVADGMDYLSSLKFIHRDLAARNILLTGSLNAKISDFGLCRRTNEAFYTAKGGKLPIKWMAVESLKRCEFNVETDVWSFGVLLFEIFSLGDAPYSSLQPDEVVDYLEGGNRMKQPKHCPTEIYSLMLQCWDGDSLKRPGFADLRAKFSSMIDANDENYGYLSLEVQEQTK